MVGVTGTSEVGGGETIPRRAIRAEVNIVLLKLLLVLGTLDSDGGAGNGTAGGGFGDCP